MTDASPDNPADKTIGRNEPCPCGSGKKFKRCCGVGAAPKLSPPSAGTLAGPATPGTTGTSIPPQIPGMDQFDPKMLAQLSQMVQRLPRGQMQRLQAVMQKAMSGRDVSREAAELEGQLPVEFQILLKQMQGAAASAAPAKPEPPVSAAPIEMTEVEARAIVEAAVKEGKISSEQAAKLLGQSSKS